MVRGAMGWLGHEVQSINPKSWTLKVWEDLQKTEKKHKDKARQSVMQKDRYVTALSTFGEVSYFDRRPSCDGRLVVLACASGMCELMLP